MEGKGKGVRGEGEKEEEPKEAERGREAGERRGVMAAATSSGERWKGREVYVGSRRKMVCLSGWRREWVGFVSERDRTDPYTYHQGRNVQ